jgi:hypothetical protein
MRRKAHVPQQGGDALSINSIRLDYAGGAAERPAVFLAPFARRVIIEAPM